MNKFYLGDSENRTPESSFEVYRTWIYRTSVSSQVQLGCPAGGLVDVVLLLDVTSTSP